MKSLDNGLCMYSGDDRRASNVPTEIVSAMMVNIFLFFF